MTLSVLQYNMAKHTDVKKMLVFCQKDTKNGQQMMFRLLASLQDYRKASSRVGLQDAQDPLRSERYAFPRQCNIGV